MRETGPTGSHGPPASSFPSEPDFLPPDSGFFSCFLPRSRVGPLPRRMSRPSCHVGWLATPPLPPATSSVPRQLVPRRQSRAPCHVCSPWHGVSCIPWHVRGSHPSDRCHPSDVRCHPSYPSCLSSCHSSGGPPSLVRLAA
jgi:hypothetical protein